MKRSLRFVKLLHLLSGRRSRSFAELKSHFDVSERTLYRDLSELSHQTALTRDEHGYRLLESATIRPLNLTAAEHAVLRLALSNQQLKKVPALFHWLETLEAKLDAAMTGHEETPEAMLLAGVDRTGPAASEAMEPLEHAISTRHSARIRYASLSRNAETQREMDPYHLYQRGETWYLVGRCHVHNDIRTFRLDRILNVQVQDSEFEPLPDFNLQEHLEGTWRAFRGGEEHSIELLFEPGLAPLVLNACLHSGEQKEELPDGSIRYIATLNSLEEIARWIIGFGGRVKVAAPEELRRLCHDLARGSAEALAPGD
jgi:predicted DNA-binding transcriptional regulator YafY